MANGQCCCSAAAPIAAAAAAVHWTGVMHHRRPRGGWLCLLRASLAGRHRRFADVNGNRATNPAAAADKLLGVSPLGFVGRVGGWQAETRLEGVAHSQQQQQRPRAFYLTVHRMSRIHRPTSDLFYSSIANIVSHGFVV